MPAQPNVAVVPQMLTIAIASLSIGGAEKIVVDHAARLQPRQELHLVVLRDRAVEWPVPAGVRVTRLESGTLHDRFSHIPSAGERRLAQLRQLGADLARSPNPVCLCHLLSAAERAALASGGADCVPVLHNAAAGWGEGAAALAGEPRVVAVSAAAAAELRAFGYPGHIEVIRHVPPRRPDMVPRAEARGCWGLPLGAPVIGMIGAVKRQKNYLRALEVLAAANLTRPVYLCILGGPVNTAEGRLAWQGLVAAVEASGLRHRVAMPGFVPDAGRYLSAFDLVLNTSDFEGLSIATLEALQAGLPVVASRVGGQGEVAADNLFLYEPTVTPAEIAGLLLPLLGRRYPRPSWGGIESHRLWTLAGLVPGRAVGSGSGEVLFVTANLNSGGAQRSLVNLVSGLRGRFSVCVAGPSTSGVFHRRLREAGVDTWCASHSYRPFDNAEPIVAEAVRRNVSTICFWNLDPKVKLLVAKALCHTRVSLVDVSPGGYAFDEMAAVAPFAELIGFGADDYYARLSRLVHKYHPAGGAAGVVIPNGVDTAVPVRRDYALGSTPRIVVNGRLAPSKFVVEIVRAVRIVRSRFPGVELHLLGGSEAQHGDYRDAVDAEIAKDPAGTTFIHGHSDTTPGLLALFDLQVTLGRHQGCPNATLEALAAGLPLVANRDGGTGEQVIDGETGLLLESCHPVEISRAIVRLLADRRLAARVGRQGRRHVEQHFSLRAMRRAYEELFTSLAPQPAAAPNPKEEPCISPLPPMTTRNWSANAALPARAAVWQGASPAAATASSAL